MLKIFLIWVLGILCVGCASTTANVSSVKVQNQKPVKKEQYSKGCRMMPHGYLVCPKAVRT